jgi:hypothetical protein
LPIWLDLFPEAKIIHVYRNGVDVANSLNVRAKRDIAAVGEWMERRRRRYGIGRHLFRRFALSLRCLSIREAFSLWEAYVEQAQAHVDSLPEDRAMSIRYEDLVTDPKPFIAKLHEFAGIESSREMTDALASQFKPARARAYTENPELVEFYESVVDSPQMRRLSYELDDSSR